jgi:hypothetical protein
LLRRGRTAKKLMALGLMSLIQWMGGVLFLAGSNSEGANFPCASHSEGTNFSVRILQF